MNEYKIEHRASGSSSHYYVYKALGPFPFKNWSWQSVYDSSSRKSCEKWIEKTRFKESYEGQRLAFLEEQAQEERREQTLKKREMMANKGWIFDFNRAVFINHEGEIRVEPI